MTPDFLTTAFSNKRLVSLPWLQRVWVNVCLLLVDQFHLFILPFWTAILHIFIPLHGNVLGSRWLIMSNQTFSNSNIHPGKQLLCKAEIEWAAHQSVFCHMPHQMVFHIIILLCGSCISWSCSSDLIHPNLSRTTEIKYGVTKRHKWDSVRRSRIHWN